jgi:hypothetical protein
MEGFLFSNEEVGKLWRAHGLKRCAKPEPTADKEMY